MVMRTDSHPYQTLNSFPKLRLTISLLSLLYSSLIPIRRDITAFLTSHFVLEYVGRLRQKNKVRFANLHRVSS